MIEINPRHLEKLLTESVRYCLGRKSYAVSECTDIVRKYWKEIGDNPRFVIKRDISDEIKRHDDWIAIDLRNLQAEGSYIKKLEDGHSLLGMECDAFNWIELLDWIDEQEKQNATTN